MKKTIITIAALIMVFALAIPVLANPGQNPNRNPGSPEMISGSYTVRVTGGGNNLVIDILRDGVVVYPRVPRAGNGTFSQTFTTTSGHVIFIQVQGNSLRNATVTAPEPVVYIVEQYSRWNFVRYNRIASRFVGTTEVEGTREFAPNLVEAFEARRCNEIPGVNGNAVISGARVTGTLSYQYERNYVAQEEAIYELVDVTVWSNGARTYAVRPGYEHIVRYVLDRHSYPIGPFDGTRAIDVAGGDFILHMGHGQSDAHGRFITVLGAFNLTMELLNTGNPPTITVTLTGVNLEAL